jgi:hypothetical protein
MRARLGGAHDDIGWCDLGVLGDRESKRRQPADENDQNGKYRCEDRAVDEKVSKSRHNRTRVYDELPSVPERVIRSASTFVPGRIF